MSIPCPMIPPFQDPFLGPTSFENLISRVRRTCGFLNKDSHLNPPAPKRHSRSVINVDASISSPSKSRNLNDALGTESLISHCPLKSGGETVPTCSPFSPYQLCRTKRHCVHGRKHPHDCSVLESCVCLP